MVIIKDAIPINELFNNLDKMTKLIFYKLFFDTPDAIYWKENIRNQEMKYKRGEVECKIQIHSIRVAMIKLEASMIINESTNGRKIEYALSDYGKHIVQLLKKNGQKK